MRLDKSRRRRSFFVGAIIFFCFIAAIIQVAIWVYDYTVARTENGITVLLVMLLVTVLLSLIATFYDYARHRSTVEEPVDRILEATEKIASGDFSVRLETKHPYGSYDEFDLICENLNTMAKELSKSEILKTDFISNVSHEIKTPIAVIQSYATMLAGSSLDEPSRKRYADILLAASTKLTGLVTNILKLNKLENQAIEAPDERVNLSDLIAECVIGFEELIEKKQLEISCELDEVTVISSASHLEIVFNNLLSNAIKFTEPGGRINIRLGREYDRAVIEFSDTGCGISADTGKHIFEKFYQADTSHSGEGNGLGLALVKKVIDCLGGDISVKSELGVGSTFKITLKSAVITPGEKSYEH